MKLFHYIITDDEISEHKGEINSVPKGFGVYKEGMMGQRVFYNIVNGELKEVIAEASNPVSADRLAEDFVAGFNVDIGM